MGASTAWIVLVAAGLLETVWAFAMKRSDGFTKLGPGLVTLAAALLSLLAGLKLGGA